MKFIPFPGTEHGQMTLWNDRGDSIATYAPHGSATKAVQIHGDHVLSVGDIVCIYSKQRKMWIKAGWNTTALTDVEWLNDEKFLVADFMGTITLDTLEEDKYIPVGPS